MNSSFRCWVVLSLGLFLATFTIQSTFAAESQERSIAVTNIVKLLQGDIGEDVIIAKLKKEGQTFDLSTDEIIELKKAGASSQVLKTMLDPNAGITPPAEAKAAASTTNEVDDSFWLYDADKKIPLTKAHVEITAKPDAAFIITGTVHAFATLSESGPAAEIRVTNRNPQFGKLAVPLNLRVAELVHLVKLKLDSGKKHRRLEVAKGGGFSGVNMTDSKMRVPITFDEVGETTLSGKKARLYRARPVAPLEPGEYAIVISFTEYFDFGIDDDASSSSQSVGATNVITDPAVEKLCQMLEQDNPGKVKDALNKLGDKKLKDNASQAVPKILPCLANSNPGVVLEACRTLADIGNKDTIPSLEPLLTHPKPDIRDEAYKAIAKLRGGGGP